MTHMLTGAVLARAGFNRKAAYATAAMAIAAELPDIDILWGYVRGPVAGFEHHRGITHTFLAIPVEALLLVGCFWLTERWRKHRTHAPVNWAWLYARCLLALCSHILLDWTNNYGVRPFFPFNPRWYAGSFVFIFEPVLFAILLLALLAPMLFGLINSEVGSRKERFRGRGWAIAGLIAIAMLYVFRYTEREKAIQIATTNQPEGTTRIFASPHPINPFLWSMVSDAPSLYQLSTVDTRRTIVLPLTPGDTLYKPAVSLPILRAKRTFLGRIYLDWSMYPVLEESPNNEDPSHPLTEVTFSDARFMYDTILMKGRAKSPISGSVLLDMGAPEDDRVVETRMGSKVQK